MKSDIKSMTLLQLEELLAGMGEKPFRGRQIYRWLRKGISGFSEMTDLSAGLRNRLEEIAYLSYLIPLKTQVSMLDGTRKYLFGLEDGHAIESVLMRYKHGNSVCLSSQAGCRMGCSFCASGIYGLSRNLTAGEMEGQILHIIKDTGEKISNVVVMGTGEPFDNYDNLSIFLNNIHDKEGLGLSWRSITVSTCGIVPKIKEFGKDFPQVNLAVSLHASDDKIRDILMPINRKYPLEEVLEACRMHAEMTGRRVTLEYALVDGINDDKSHALALGQKLKGMLCHVNLIPLNPINESKWKGTVRYKAEVFMQILEGKGVPVTLRRELGRDIDGACGQLRLLEGEK